MQDFEASGLRAELRRAVSSEGYATPTPIQAQAIPAVLQGRDLMAAAQTGTGKTAAFTLPLLHNLSQQAPGKGKRAIRALVLTPTRELAAQVGKSVHTYGANLPLRSTEIFGGVKMNPQIHKLRQGVDILVATPGRLLDHMRQGHIDLSQVETLILDEADRMLDMGFIHDIRKVIKAVPDNRQTLMFSATFSKEIRKLAEDLVHNPERIEIAPEQTTAERVEQVVHPVDQPNKRALLSRLIGRGDWQQVLVFTRTKHGANKLSQQLEEDGITSAAIHGNKSQAQRTKALSGFKGGKVRALVATDIAARGLDIDQLPHVVNFDLPNVPEDYVHRIGRTGRAGQSGRAVSLVAPAENRMLKDIEKVLKTQLPREKVPGYEPAPGQKQSQDNRGGGKSGRNAGGKGNQRASGNRRNGNNGKRGGNGQGRNGNRSPQRRRATA